MALTKPFINTISAFDANNGTTININVLGGDAITSYAFNLYSNVGSLIYTSPKFVVNNDIANATIRTFPITLTSSMGIENNGNYQIQPITYNLGNADGMIGQAANFVCYSTPIVKLYYYDIRDGVADYYEFKNGSVVGATTPNIKIEFSPNDLNSIAEPNIANVVVYGINGKNKNLVYESGDIYNFSHDIVADLYSITTDISGFTINVNSSGNLVTDRLYDSFQVELNLRTIENYQIQPIIVDNITCYYATLRNSPYFVVNNLCAEGKIEINSKLTSYMGTSNPTPPIYINNQEIDLTGDGSWVQWAKYFELKQPYTFRLWGRNFNVGQIADLSQSTCPNKHIIIKYNQEDVYNETAKEYENYTFISLESGQSKNIDGVDYFYPYYIESDRILTSLITATTKLFINVQEQEEMFDITFQILN